MPNTSPAIDNAGTVALIHERAAQANGINVFVTGAITKNIAGEELAPIGSLKKAGVVAITDDGHCVQNNELMRRACEYAKMFDLPVMDHCQDYSLVTDGVMHEGYWSTALGLRGWPAAGEEMIVARNILLAELTGAKIHCQHLSAAGSVALAARSQKTRRADFRRSLSASFHSDRRGRRRQRKILGERRQNSGRHRKPTNFRHGRATTRISK